MASGRTAQRVDGGSGMTLPRIVGRETLDHLAADDPAAVRSRRDLQRVHRAMGTRRIVQRALRGLPGLAQRRAPLRVLELGAGDGRLMLGVARSLTHTSPAWPAVELSLLDRQALVTADTIAAYAALGWHATSDVRDVFDWAEAARATSPATPPEVARFDLIVANLFLHHFEGPALGTVLSAMALRGDRCLACEPRRSRTALLGSHLVGALGANAVTRQDAVLSVHAGFRGAELSSAWPQAVGAWQLNEYPAGLFSHCFVAQRREVRR